MLDQVAGVGAVAAGVAARSVARAGMEASTVEQSAPVNAPVLVDDLAALGMGERDGVVERGVAVGADEAMLLGDAVDLLDDHAGGLILPGLLVRFGADREALIF